VAGLSTGARLHRLDAALAGARAAGISERLVRDLLTLERPSGIAAADAARLFPDYLASVERLVRTVDGWHS
jgi:hypothetical protein